MRAAYHAPAYSWPPGCGCMIHHNPDSEMHKVFGVKEFKSNSYNNKRKAHHENNIFYISHGGSGGDAKAGSGNEKS